MTCTKVTLSDTNSCGQYKVFSFLQRTKKYILTKWSKYEVCPEGIQPCNMNNRDIYWRRYKILETLFIGQWHLSPLQSGHLGTSHSSPISHQLHHRIFLNLIDSETSSLSKVTLVFGKARSHKVPNLGYKGVESPGWFDVLPKPATWDMMHEGAHCHDEAAKHQMPIALPSESSE